MGKESENEIMGLLGVLERRGKECPNLRNVSAEVGGLLRFLVELRRPRQVLEIGTSNGYSALWLGLGARAVGARVVTLEKVDWKVREAKSNIDEAGLGNVVEVRFEKAQKYLARQISTPEFIFMDILSSEYPGILDLLRGKIKPGTLIVADNITSHRDRNGRVLDCKDESKPYLKRLETEGITSTFIDRGSGLSLAHFNRFY